MMWVVVLLDCEGWRAFAYNSTTGAPLVAAVGSSGAFPVWGCLGITAALLSVVICVATQWTDP